MTNLPKWTLVDESVSGQTLEDFVQKGTLTFLVRTIANGLQWFVFEELGLYA